MKRILLFCTLYYVLCIPAFAVNYCATQSWGYAGTSVTGGGSATPTLVSNESQLATALNTKNSVILITQDITVTNHISSDKSNLTIMALPGKKLISNQQNKENSGILYLKGNNILIRNVTFVGPGAYDCDGWDNLCLDKATNVWVDHCDFQDGCDGNFDIKGTSDNITVTWCRFRYLKAPKAGGSGGSDDHRFSNLVGSGSSDKPTDGTYNITYGFCWWDEGCKQRMTRCRNALIHFLNCYWNSSVADYYVGPENASCYFEGCVFAGKANSAKGIWSPFSGSTNYYNFVNCSGNMPTGNSSSVKAPTYAYDQMSAAAAKSMVTNSTCGAGATLTVTNTAEVSSSCDGEGPVDPQPVAGDVWWNISDNDFKDLGTMTSEKTVRDLHIVATSEKPVTVDAKTGTYGTLNFTHRLKLGGTGNANYRHLWFDVKGECLVSVYMMSSNSDYTRTLKIATGSFDNAVASQEASVGSIGVMSYEYKGAATTIYLYGSDGGVNIYGIQLSYPTPTGMELIEDHRATQKVLRDGQLVILRNGKTYSVTGAVLQ